MKTTSYFYDTIHRLRTQEELILYDRVLDFKTDEEDVVKEFLQLEYETESENYPFSAPVFDPEAALWAAKITYTICQLILYRENKEEELPGLLPAYPGEMNPSAILSVDLCLRFLPQVLTRTKHIDPDDKLMELAEKIMELWHYSAIAYSLETTNLDLVTIMGNQCLSQLYVDRVILKKDTARADLSLLHEKIKETLGDYSREFWSELKYTN